MTLLQFPSAHVTLWMEAEIPITTAAALCDGDTKLKRDPGSHRNHHYDTRNKNHQLIIQQLTQDSDV